MATPIIGQSTVTVDQCEAFLRKQNPNAPALANIYKKYCDIYGIRLECIWVQMCLETNFLRYSNTSITTLDMNNFCGLGAIDGNGRRQALSFSTEDEGVKCHVQHLYAYCTNKPLPQGQSVIDPRFKYVARGIAPNIENLGNGNWASDKNYASKLLSLLSQLLNSGNITNKTNSGSNSDFIREIQHDLQRLSCLAAGESNATGELDANTKAAIKQFRYIVDLPSGESIDTSLVSALNSITSKPTIGAGWTINIIATKFIQWFIGISPKSGVFDNNTVEKVKQWQVTAGIWSASGADGVIREVDWNKILK